MAADFKSHVLLRDEKGVFGIPFKRLLLAGVGGGLTYTLFSLAVPGWSIPVAVVTGIAIVVLTGPRGGIPLWNRLVYRLRGTLQVAAVKAPGFGDRRKEMLRDMARALDQGGPDALAFGQHAPSARRSEGDGG